MEITSRTSNLGGSHVRRIRPTRVGFDALGAEYRRVLLAAVRSADGTLRVRKAGRTGGLPSLRRDRLPVKRTRHGGAGPLAPVLRHFPAQSVRINWDSGPCLGRALETASV